MRLDHLRIAGLALLFFLPFLGGVHLFDWDEINFAECAREMLTTSDYLRPQIDYQPFFGTPPFFIWLQVLSMKIFGVGEFAARLPNAIAGVLTMLLAYHLGRRLHDRTFGWLWALAWLGSLLPHLYFRSGIIDPWFNLLIFAGLFGFIEFRWLFFTRYEGRTFWQRYRYLLIGGWLLGLAILTQGPTAFLIVLIVLVLYWARYKFRNRGFLKHMILYSLAAFSLPALWFLAETMVHGPHFAQEFLIYQIRQFSTPDSEHGGFFGYQVPVLLLGCFPVSVFALSNLWGDNQPEDELLESNALATCQRSDLTTWMQILFWVVFGLFSLVQTKAMHYSSLAYFPLTYLGVLTVWRAIRWDYWPRFVGLLIPVLGVLIGSAQMLMPIVGTNPDWLQPFFENDPFAMARLHVAVEWHWWQGLPGAVLLVTSLVAWWHWQKKRPWLAAQTAFTGGSLFVAFTLLLCIKNMERYVQFSTIEFYESKVGHDCLVKPIGFKSYAHLFYSKKAPVAGGQTIGSLRASGKKMYFVVKQTNLQDLPGCQEIFRLDGMVYYEQQ